MSFNPDDYLQQGNSDQTFDPDAHLLSTEPTNQNTQPESKGLLQKAKDYVGNYIKNNFNSVSNLASEFGNHPLRSIGQSVEGLPAAVAAPVAHALGSGAAITENAISHIPGAQYLGYDPNSTYEKTNAAYQEEIGKEVDPRSEIGKRYSDVLGSAFKPVGDLFTLPGNIAEHASQALGASKNTAKSIGEQTNAVTNLAALSYGSRKASEDQAITKEAIEPSSKEINLKKADDLGLVKPPATSNPTTLNKLAEGYAGKVSTAQAASVKNRDIFNDVAKKALDLPKDAELTPETMEAVRDAQSPHYEAIKQVQNIKFGSEYNNELSNLTKTADKITSSLPNFKSTASQQIKDLVESIKPQNGMMDGETAVELSKALRSEASAYDANAIRTGDPSAKALARAYRGSASAVENAIEDHLNNIGQPELAKNWDNARRTIAKSYTIQNALDGAGNIDATKLGKQLIKGKPLSGDLEAIADFANTYPKASKPTNESMPGMSPLDVYGSVGTAIATGSPIPLVIGPGRMATRKALLSPIGQYLGKKKDSAIPGVNYSQAVKPITLAAMLATNDSDRQRKTSK